MNDTEKMQALDHYFRLMSMNGAMELFHAAQQHGVLAAVLAGKRTAGEVAAACALHARAVGLLLRALAASGLLLKRDDGYLPAPVLGFLTGTYQDLGGEYWHHLPTFLKTGEPLRRMDNPEEGRQHYEAQARSLHWMMLPVATVTATLLGIGTTRKELAILDVGAGSGVWGTTFAQHDPGTRVTAIDWAPILAIAKEFAAQVGVGDRFLPLPGNYHEVALAPAAYDLAIVANVLHLETEEGIRHLFRRLRAALKSDGCVLVVDVFHDQPGGELNAAVYEFGLALRTDQGTVHPPERIATCLRECGFRPATPQRIPVTPYTMGMILATLGENQ